MSEADLQGWLKQLLDLAVAGDNSGTVTSLYAGLKEQHPRLRLADVYSALMYLRENCRGLLE
jgi:Fe2+ or Zn2+ uptake regulation protein